MSIPTTDELLNELRKLIKTVPAFKKHNYSVFDLDDFRIRASQQGLDLPVVGVAYDGCTPIGKDDTAIAEGSNSVTIEVMQFIVIVAVQYQYAEQEDNKPQGTELLQQVREIVKGFKGVNSRPWRFMGERPEPDASGEGIIFYSQVWQTALPSIGKSFNT